MLRLGLALGSTSAREPQHLLHSTVISATTRLHVPFRTFAKQKDSGIKKQKYTTKQIIKHERAISGLRHRRESWLDSPRLKTISRKRKPLRQRLYSLNTDTRITRYIKNLKEDQKEHPNREPNETWVRTLADQGRISPENAATLTDFIMNESAHKPEDLRPRTYEVLLEMWHRRKDVERATQVFETMRTHGKLTDYAYAVYCKCLSTRGQLDKAKEMMAERLENPLLKGDETIRVMVNYLGADNIEAGLQLYGVWEKKWADAAKIHEKLKYYNDTKRIMREQAIKAEKVQGEGEGEKVQGEGEGEKVQGEGEGEKVQGEGEGEKVQGEGEGEKVQGEGEGEKVKSEGAKEKKGKRAKKKGKRAKEEVQVGERPTQAEIEATRNVFSHKDELDSIIIGWCLKYGKESKAEEIYQERRSYKEKLCPKYTDKSYSVQVQAYEKSVKEHNEARAKYEEEVRKLKEDPNPEAYNRAVRSGMLKKQRVIVRPYPVRYTKEEFLEKFPVAFTSHVLRPLIDIACAGKDIDPKWLKRIGDGLRRDDERMGIKTIAQKVYLGDKKRFDALQDLLKKMNLDWEILAKIPLPKVKGVAPVRTKKTSEIKKWWLVGGRISQQED